jgi:hypothetical protein
MAVTDETVRGPLGDARPDAGENGETMRPSLPPEDVEDRENVGIVKPEDYPLSDRQIANPGQNRGRRPSTGSGEVSGSGAGAGGGGTPEDYDDDPQGGGGNFNQQPMRDAPDSGADAPVGGSR